MSTATPGDSLAAETAELSAQTFGTAFGPIMTQCRFMDGAWHAIEVVPLSLHPATHALHYASTGFEGMKAFQQPDGGVKVFRLDAHVARFQRTAAGLHLPVPSAEIVAEMIRTAVNENKSVVPSPPAALSPRPTIIGSDINIGAVTQPSRSALVFVIVSPLANYFAADYPVVTNRPLHQTWLEGPAKTLIIGPSRDSIDQNTTAPFRAFGPK